MEWGQGTGQCRVGKPGGRSWGRGRAERKGAGVVAGQARPGLGQGQGQGSQARAGDDAGKTRI